MRFFFVLLCWRTILRVLTGLAGGLFLTSVLTVQPRGFEFFWPTLIAAYLVAGGIYKIVDERRAGGIVMLLGYTLATAITLSLPWSVWSGDAQTHPINIIVAFAPFVWVVWGFLKYSSLLWPLPIVGAAAAILFVAVKELPGLIWMGAACVAEWVHDVFTKKRAKTVTGTAPATTSGEVASRDDLRTERP